MKYEQQDHVGNRIEIRQGNREPELLIDGPRIAYGRLPDDQYFLAFATSSPAQGPSGRPQ